MKIAASPTLSPDPEVAELRHSSRLLVRVLGLMRGRVNGVDCTPAQCHALVELGEHGRLTTVELAGLLEVDKSTASRTLAPLTRNGWVEAQSDPGDQRAKPMCLTAEGRAKVAQIHAAADAQVRGALDLLSEEERGIVLRGVSLYERALHRAKALAGVVMRPIEPHDEGAVARIIRSVMTEHGAVGPGYSIQDAEVDTMHAAYSAPRHAYFVVERDGVVLAAGGIAPLAGCERDDVAELRKMYALPEARGLGVGRMLLDRCLEVAREEGFRQCYLETLQHMHRARALYEKAGFRELDHAMGKTGHAACNGWYLLDL